MGAYGEIIEYENSDHVTAEMRGPVEVVLGSPGLLISTRTGKAEFQPARRPRDFVTGNFEPMELAQMLIIPKSLPRGYSSLAGMQDEKRRELSRQTYTESREHFIIVTTGRLSGSSDAA